MQRAAVGVDPRPDGAMLAGEGGTLGPTPNGAHCTLPMRCLTLRTSRACSSYERVRDLLEASLLLERRAELAGTFAHVGAHEDA